MANLVSLKSDSVKNELLKLTHTWSVDGLSSYQEAASKPFPELIEGLHSCNFFSWHADDRSRANQSDSVLMNAKRELDASNLMRSNFMEAIDQQVVTTLELTPVDDFVGVQINSETVGQMIDRLSVQTLKRFFLEKRLSADAANQSLERVDRQLEYVSVCLDRFVDGLVNGHAHMLAYRQYKTYKPPSQN